MDKSLFDIQNFIWKFWSFSNGIEGNWFLERRLLFTNSHNQKINFWEACLKSINWNGSRFFSKSEITPTTYTPNRPVRMPQDFRELYDICQQDFWLQGNLRIFHCFKRIIADISKNVGVWKAIIFSKNI